MAQKQGDLHVHSSGVEKVYGQEDHQIHIDAPACFPHVDVLVAENLK